MGPDKGERAAEAGLDEGWRSVHPPHSTGNTLNFEELNSKVVRSLCSETREADSH